MTLGADSPQPLLFRYEHLVRLNDAALPVTPLSREQVWEGLLGRVRFPDRYDPLITALEVHFCHDGIWHRHYRRAGVDIKDRATAHDRNLVTFVTLAPADFRSSSLSIAMEEPSPGELFLRFTYDLRGCGQIPTEEEAGVLRATYHQADLEYVRRLRELALLKRSDPS
jgi:Domain of unknown function (DUF1857)